MKAAKIDDTQLIDRIFTFILEILSTIDFISDGYLLVKFARSTHVMWMCLTVNTIVWPFFVALVPYINFRLESFK